MTEISLNYGTKKIATEIPERNYSGMLEVNEPQGMKDPEAGILQCL